jgi:hypothetical protein
VVSSLFALVASAQQFKLPDPSNFRRLEPNHRSNRSQAYRDLVHAQASSGNTVPLWNYSIVAAQDNNTYQGSIVGRSPYYHGYRSTTVQAYLVPVILNFTNGSTLDPAAYDGCVGDSVVDLIQNSPIFRRVDFIFSGSQGQNPVDAGVTQFGDATQRANFWKYVAPSSTVTLPYHTLLKLNTLATVSVTVPASEGSVYPGTCSYAVMDYDWWDNYVTGTLIPSLSGQGVGPTTLPIFVFDSAIMSIDGQCCATGDHGSYFPSQLLQTYIVADFDTSGQWEPDIETLSHEVAEWMNDPDNANLTPSWGHVGQVYGCSDILEVADGLTGTTYTVPMSGWEAEPDGFTYNPQELVYFSWFYDQVPSIGAGGWYSDQGTFTTDSGQVCQGSVDSDTIGGATTQPKGV